MTYKNFAINIATKAGKIIQQNFKLGMVSQWKKDNSPVTKTDLAINRLLIKKVGIYFPNHSVRGEESSAFKKSDYEWVVDPVDGTLLFSHGLHGSVFSLALAFKGRIILAVVNDPFHKRMFISEKGRGTILIYDKKKKQAKVSSVKKLAGSLVSLELPPVDTALGPNQFGLLSQGVLAKGGRFLCFGSTIQIGCLVACGEFAGVIYSGTQPHDGASIKLLVEEAGGKVTDLYGNEQSYNGPIKGYIASNGLVHNELLKIVLPALKQSKAVH